MFRIEQSLERTRADVRSAFQRVGITPEGEGDDDRIEGAIVENLAPSTWVLVDLAPADGDGVGTVLTVEVRDLETGDPHGTAIPDSELESELVGALEAVSECEVVSVPSNGSGDDDENGEWGPTRWERR